MSKLFIFIILMPFLYWFVGVSLASFINAENYYTLSVFEWDKGSRAVYASLVLLTLLMAIAVFADR